MKFKSISWIMAGLLTALVSVNTWAANPGATCTAGNFSYSTGYSPATTVDTVTQLNFDVTCVRNSTGSFIQVNYAVAFDNGIHALLLQNRAQNVLFLNYEFYKDSACTVTAKLQGTTTYTGTTPLMDASLTYVIPNTFYACIPKTQTAVAPSKAYTDTVTLTITGSKVGTGAFDFVGVNGSGSVNIIAPATCTISTPPGPVAFGTYTSMGAAAVGSTSYVVNCSNTLPYTMSLDSAFGVVAGLNYSVGLTANATATTGTPSLTPSGGGTGIAQTFYIKGNMASGQAGSCAGGCGVVKTDPRVLTITY